MCFFTQKEDPQVWSFLDESPQLESSGVWFPCQESLPGFCLFGHHHHLRAPKKMLRHPHAHYKKTLKERCLYQKMWWCFDQLLTFHHIQKTPSQLPHDDYLENSVTLRTEIHLHSFIYGGDFPLRGVTL